MTQTRDIVQAVADPTRGQIIGMLAQKSLDDLKTILRY